MLLPKQKSINRSQPVTVHDYVQLPVPWRPGLQYWLLLLQKAFPLYHEKFPQWSQHTSGMHQLAVWTMLEDAGFGASLQHYNPLIDEEVIATWKLPATWELIAQMPFGLPLEPPQKKEYKPLCDRVRVFK